MTKPGAVVVDKSGVPGRFVVNGKVGTAALSRTHNGMEGVRGSLGSSEG
jgi:hypothetical protein